MTGPLTGPPGGIPELLPIDLECPTCGAWPGHPCYEYVDNEKQVIPGYHEDREDRVEDPPP